MTATPTPSDLHEPTREVLEAFGFSTATLRRLSGGHINATFEVALGAERYVLQRLHPVFGPEVHEDIEAVTAHLAACGLLTPRLVRARDGALWVRDQRQGIWRTLTFIDGVTHERAGAPELCRQAGMLVGRFHAAVRTLTHTFVHRRAGVHDTARHLRRLREALESHPAHPAREQVQRLAHEIFARAASLPSFAELPARVVHGDLKLTNILFSSGGEALALIDLDTVGEMALPLELGDAWRSWCNPYGEDNPACRFELSHFEAALCGYREHAHALVTSAEREALPHAVSCIALELAARFATDALEERYFAWDRERFARPSEHHLLRAESQLRLARSAAEQESKIARLVARWLG